MGKVDELGKTKTTHGHSDNGLVGFPCGIKLKLLNS